jgi:inositol transport system substrate-binding protein
MKRILLACAAVAALTTGAWAEKIGVSMALFDDNFLTVLRNGIQKYADDNGVTVQIEDAQNDVANSSTRSITS